MSHGTINCNGKRWTCIEVWMGYVDSEIFEHATARDVADKMIPVLGWIGVKLFNCRWMVLMSIGKYLTCYRKKFLVM